MRTLVFQIGLWVTVLAALLLATLMPLSIWVNRGLRLSLVPMSIGFFLSLLAYRRLAPPPLAVARPSKVIAFWVVIALVLAGTVLLLVRPVTK